MRRILLIPVLAGLLAIVAPAGSVAAEVEGVGADMGYRMFGDAKKNGAVLIQNSRSGAIEVFDDARGLFIPVQKFSDAELACRGTERVLKIRYRDDFRESVPFQVRVACGREIQFIEPAQIAPPRAMARSAFQVANDSSNADIRNAAGSATDADGSDAGIIE